MPKKIRHWIRLVWKKCPVSSYHAYMVVIIHTRYLMILLLSFMFSQSLFTFRFVFIMILIFSTFHNMYIYKRCIERATTVEAVGGSGYEPLDPATSKWVYFKGFSEETWWSVNPEPYKQKYDSSFKVSLWCITFLIPFNFKYVHMTNVQLISYSTRIEVRNCCRTLFTFEHIALLFW